jgi:hypothetical protein
MLTYFIVLYAPFLGSSGFDIDQKLTRTEVYDEVKTQLMCDLRKDTVLPFIPEESYYRVAVICDGNLMIIDLCAT